MDLDREWVGLEEMADLIEENKVTRKALRRNLLLFMSQKRWIAIGFLILLPLTIVVELAVLVYHYLEVTFVCLISIISPRLGYYFLTVDDQDPDLDLDPEQVADDQDEDDSSENEEEPKSKS